MKRFKGNNIFLIVTSMLLTAGSAVFTSCVQDEPNLKQTNSSSNNSIKPSAFVSREIGETKEYKVSQTFRIHDQVVYKPLWSSQDRLSGTTFFDWTLTAVRKEDNLFYDPQAVRVCWKLQCKVHPESEIKSQRTKHGGCYYDVAGFAPEEINFKVEIMKKKGQPGTTSLLNVSSYLTSEQNGGKFENDGLKLDQNNNSFIITYNCKEDIEDGHAADAVERCGKPVTVTFEWETYDYDTTYDYGVFVTTNPTFWGAGSTAPHGGCYQNYTYFFKTPNERSGVDCDSNIAEIPVCFKP